MRTTHWNIYYADRELAAVLGDPLLGTVTAPEPISKHEAEQIAERTIAHRMPCANLWAAPHPQKQVTSIRRIISGGQTGADRAGLDFALAYNLPIGGWCPRGRRAEDGVVPWRYPLQEHPETAYQPRTIQNILEADLTVVFARPPLSAGSRFTLNQCRKRGKEHVWLSNFPDAEADAKCLRVALGDFEGVLNIAGSRESKCPGIHHHVLRVLQLVFDEPRRIAST